MVYFNDLHDLKKLEKILQENKRKQSSTNSEEMAEKTGMQVDEAGETVNAEKEEESSKKKKIKN